MDKTPCVIIGVGGGIAAYKICALVSSLVQKGIEVHVLMTKAAQAFITPLTFQTLSRQKVVTDMFSTAFEPRVEHVSLAEKADLFVLAPATADQIAHVANGFADDMVTTTFLAASCRKLIVPAMNTGMLSNPVTQDNLEKCRHYGMRILESEEGMLACGTRGKGRLMEPAKIEDAIFEMLETDRFLEGKRVLVTAGPTREAIDPVRFLTNHSTGSMGYALARQARNMGAAVTLVSGPTQLAALSGVRLKTVNSAAEMAAAVLEESDAQDIIIMAAAVADFTPKHAEKEKIHKRADAYSLTLEPTPDILKTIGQSRKPEQIVIGFSMETEDLLANSRRKLETKNCDYIIANSLRQAGAGFGTKTNQVTILSKDRTDALPLMTKEETAREILRRCLKEKTNAADN